MKKGTQLDKNNPTLLHAYGGFGVSLGPNYSAATGIAWLDRGGVYVEANVRGGGEFGPTWHSVRKNCDCNAKHTDNFNLTKFRLVIHRLLYGVGVEDLWRILLLLRKI